MTNYNITITGSSKVEITNGDNKLDNLKLSYYRDKIPRFEFSFTDRANEFSNIKVGDEVYLSIDGNDKFKGYFEDYSISWAGRKRYSMICVGRKKDPYRYYTDEDQTYSGYTNDIASSMADDYIPGSFGYSFAFRPVDGSNNSGVELTDYKTKGKNIGACFDELARNDGYYWDVDGSKIKWFQASGSSGNYAKTFTHKDSFGVRPNNLGKNLNDNINDIKIIGGIGYVGVDTEQTAEDGGAGSRAHFQSFKTHSIYDYIDRFKFYGSFPSDSILRVSICPLFTNTGPDIYQVNSNFSNNVKMINEDDTDWADKSMSSGDTEIIAFNYNNEIKNLKQVHWLGGCYGEYSWALKYKNEDDDWLFLDSGWSDADIRAWHGTTNIDIQTSSLRLIIQNNSDSAETAAVYEFLPMEKGYDSDRWASIGSPFSNAQKEYTSKTDSNSWHPWIEFDNAVNVSGHDYLAFLIEAISGNTYVGLDYASAPSFDGRYGYWPGRPIDYWGSDNVMRHKIGWGEKIVLTSSQSVSRESERVSTVIRNREIDSMDTAEKVASGILSESTMEFKGALDFRGDSAINIYEKISGSIDPIDIDQEFTVAGYTDTIDKKGYRTRVDVNKEGYDISSKVEKIIAKAKLGEFSDT